MKEIKKFQGSLKVVNKQFAKNSMQVNNHICIISNTA